MPILLDFGADIDARTGYGKTAYVHAARRGFTEVCDLLRCRGANCSSVPADRLAMALSAEDLGKARAILAEHPDCAKTGNPEEDRLLADMAGRNNIDAVRMLVDAGADLVAPGLDDGTPLHQAAWFGQPANVRLLIDRGTPLDVFERVHGSSPLGWAVHGSHHSGGAAKRQRAYLDIVDVLIKAGSSLHYPDDPSNAYYRRLMRSGSRKVRQRLRASWHG